MEFKRQEREKKLEAKKTAAVEKAKIRMEEIKFRHKLLIEKAKESNHDGQDEKEVGSKGLQNAILALMHVQEERFNKMEELLQKIAEK